MTSCTVRRHIERGCLPVAVDHGRDAIVLSPVADLGFRESRYDRALRAHGRRPVFLVPTDRFVDAVTDLGRQPPAGVLAHVGRCGSTLMANLLGLRPSTLVLKEPGFLHNPDRRLLRALLSYCRAVAAAAGRELVVKPSSWTCPALLEAAGPTDATWLLLWRDPVEVVRSESAVPPPWADAEDTRAELARRISPVPTGPTQRYAAQWADVVEAFLPPVGPVPSVRFLSYPVFAADKRRSLLAAQAWFGLRDADATPDGFATEAARYAKAADATTFDPARAHHRPALAAADVAVVDRTTGAATARLRALDDSYLLIPRSRRAPVSSP